MRKTKPDPRVCPLCGDKVGLSVESVRVHVRLKHPGELVPSDLGSPLGSPLFGSSQFSSPRGCTQPNSPGFSPKPTLAQPSRLSSMFGDGQRSPVAGAVHAALQLGRLRAVEEGQQG